MTTLADALTITGALTFTNGTLQLKSGATTTVGSFVTTGTILKYLQSTTPGVQATISAASGTNTVTYLSIQDSNATGGAVWDSLDPTNVDAGNNTGWLFPSTSITVTPTGVEAIGAIGDVTVVILNPTSITVLVTGVETNGAIGDAVVTGTAFVYPTGVSVTGSVGDVTVAIDIFVYPTGVSATGSIGDVTVSISVTALVTGVQADGAIGTVTVIVDALVYLIGVVAYGLIGPVNVWGLVNNAQNPNWSIIADGQSPVWEPVPTPSTPSWQPVVN